jgi:hypothetical protein
MNALRRFRVPLFAALALAGSAVACGGTTTTSHAGGDDAGSDGQHPRGPGDDAPISCGAVGIVPPTVTVRNAATGDLICDPIITIVTDGSVNGSEDAGPGNGYPCTAGYAGCAAPDGGSISCVFTVSQVEENPATIQVSAPGYISKSVPNVTAGLIGCVENPSAGTAVNVSLEPAPTHPTPAPPDAG